MKPSLMNVAISAAVIVSIIGSGKYYNTPEWRCKTVLCSFICLLLRTSQGASRKVLVQMFINGIEERVYRGALNVYSEAIVVSVTAVHLAIIWLSHGKIKLVCEYPMISVEPREKKYRNRLDDDHEH